MILKYQNIFSQYLESSITERSPKNLYDPCNYILSLGGKRIRPIMLLLTYDCINKNLTRALPAALSIELFHNFTLIHDDIMDEASLRRGKTTIHKKWNLNTGILSGDVMLIWSYQCLELYDSKLFKKLTSLLNNTSRMVCEGQQYDIDFTKTPKVSKKDYLKMIKLKTAVLLGCSMKMGALIGGLSESESDKFYFYGINLGIAFQLKDDYLDLFGENKKFGKKNGGDIIENKKTLMYIFALNNSDNYQKSKLIKFFTEKPLKSELKIKSVKEIFLKTGADKDIKKEIKYYEKKAMEGIKSFSVSNKNKKIFEKLTIDLMSREI